MVKAVIFDLDGVIVDTEILHSRAHEKVIKKYGKKPVKLKSGVYHIVGKSIKENSEIIKKKYSIASSAEILEWDKHTAFLKILSKEKIVAMSGFKYLIRLMKSKRIKIAVASTGIKKGVFSMLKSIKMKDKFSVILTLDDVTYPKPNPEIFLKAAKKLHVESEQCLVLEDSQSGVEAGNSAGMKVIAIPNKYTNHQDFSKADLVVNSLKDIKWSTISNI